MEALRWVLLAAGIAFVVVIYLLGRSRRQRSHSLVDEFEAGQDDGLPEFNAGSLDDVDEGVGKVRIISSADLDSDEDYRHEDQPHSVAVAEDNSPVASERQAESESQTESLDNRRSTKAPSDFIVLYILPKINPQKNNLGNSQRAGTQFLLGSQINSAVQAMGLSFGEMNIFHYKSANQTVFSLANMLEPGSFDADTMHDIKTTGLTTFMKINGDDPLDDLTEMLQRSYQIAALLGARLCNHKRQTLTEQDAENYRSQVRKFVDNEKSENKIIPD